MKKIIILNIGSTNKFNLFRHINIPSMVTRFVSCGGVSEGTAFVCQRGAAFAVPLVLCL